jgi:4-diphosphocytidyl-2-C-methyl-D-erythritol kinase
VGRVRRRAQPGRPRRLPSRRAPGSSFEARLHLRKRSRSRRPRGGSATPRPPWWLAMLCGVPIQPPRAGARIAESLGSDVPFLLAEHRAGHGRGRRSPGAGPRTSGTGCSPSLRRLSTPRSRRVDRLRARDQAPQPLESTDALLAALRQRDPALPAPARSLAAAVPAPIWLPRSRPGGLRARTRRWSAAAAPPVFPASDEAHGDEIADAVSLARTRVGARARSRARGVDWLTRQPRLWQATVTGRLFTDVDRSR